MAGYCTCNCHQEHNDQHAALFNLTVLVMSVLSPAPDGLRGAGHFHQCDSALSNLLDDLAPVFSPRTTGIMVRIAHEVVHPFRFKLLQPDAISVSAVIGEETQAQADELYEYLPPLQHQLLPYVRELAALAMEEPEESSDGHGQARRTLAQSLLDTAEALHPDADDSSIVDRILNDLQLD